MDLYTLGIDVGSTASKCVILKNGKDIVAKSLIDVGAGTSGPARAIEAVLQNAGLTREQLAFTLATGYGRNSLEGIADKQMSELSCHARGAEFCFPGVRTVIDIGGQDVKVLHLENGTMVNFQMNDKCAAGTGRPLKDADGNVVIDEATGKPKKDPKTQTPYIVLDDWNEINALPDGPEKERRLAAIAPIKQMQIPMPDFVLCCNNICNCMTKWYENIARMHNIPLVMIDIPYNNTVTVDDTYVAYIRGQFDAAIKQLEQISGRKFDEEKFKKACANANRTAKAWLKVCDYLQYKPAPYSGFDLFNHMADVVTARGKVAAAEAFEQLAVDLEKAIQEGTTTTPFPEKYRVMFEGIPCAGFDGDQADPRNFNAAQYETRVQGLVEAMEANKQAKEADPQ